MFLCSVMPVILGILNPENFKTNTAKGGIACPKAEVEKKKTRSPTPGHTFNPPDSPPASKQFLEKLGYLSLAIYHVASTGPQDMRAI